MFFLVYVILPALAIAATLIAGAVCVKKGRRRAGGILLFAGGIALWGISQFFATEWLAEKTVFSGGDLLPKLALLPGAAVLAVLCFTKNKKRLKTALSVVFAAAYLCGLGGVFLTQRKYDRNPSVSAADPALSRYFPGTAGNALAGLDGACSLSFALNDDLPKLDGATALFPVYAAFANAVYPAGLFGDELWVSVVDDSAFPLKCSKTGGAYERVLTGDADMIFVAAPSEGQKRAAEEAGVKLRFTPVGKEAFVFFVNAENPLPGLTGEQVRAVYSGRIRRWRELGVKGLGKIVAFQREEDSGSQSAMLRFMGDTPLMEAPRESYLGAMGEIVERTGDYRNFKNAIGYSFRFYCNEMANAEGIRLLSLDGVAPTFETIQSGEYPETGVFYAVTREDADENTLRLLDWVVGPEGQELVEKTGYVPVG